MRPLTAPEMMRAWEAGQGRSLAHRALLLLAYASPDASWEALAALPVGERDVRLLTLREWAFGQELSSLATCPACRERLELNFTVADVRIAPAAADDLLSVKVEGHEVEFRLPNSADLESLDGVQDGRRHLLRRCIESARCRGKKRAFSRLPVRVLDTVVQRMSEADPQADAQATLTCPSCAHEWQAVFDIVSFFWEELESWVHRTLRDVHVLASAYSWREADILALSPWRRQYYLQLVQQ
ncbi:MAG: phage baseplate protein [Pseudomonadota bacterium]|nr:phage baseplate protein [Pseudomonadota bacterium]